MITSKAQKRDAGKKIPWRLTSVEPLDNFSLKVRFVDGVEGVIDMTALVLSQDARVFAPLANKDVFNKVFLYLGAVSWDPEGGNNPYNYIDLAPDAMHAAIKETGEWKLEGWEKD
jgi:Protein of unknown function (DUF2442)